MRSTPCDSYLSIKVKKSMSTHSAQERIEQVLRQAGVDKAGLATAIAKVTAAEDVNRRLLIAKSQSAFKEGFLLGKRWPKFAPYVTDIWRKSDFYSRHFAEGKVDTDHQARYAKYNDL